MIQTIIDALDAAIGLNIPTVKRYGLAELMPVEGGTMPVVYADNGSFVPIANDNSGTFSYWRYNGKETDKGVDIGGSACGGYEVTMPLRFVAMVDRTICPNVQNAARAASWAAMGTDSSIRSAINAIAVNYPTSGVDTDSRRVYQQEFGKALENADKAWVAIDITVQVTGLPDCFDPCERTGSFLCRLIQAKTWAQVQQCLTDAQEAAAITALCDIDICEEIALLDGQAVVDCISTGEVPVAMCAIIARPEATADIGVECIGNAGKTADYQALLCPTCDPLSIAINGVPAFDVTDPCGNVYDIPIADSNGAIVPVTIVGDQVRVDELPCAPCGDVEIIDQDLNVIATPACGTQYSVLVFDGIDGGLSNTTFTNSIVAP